MNLTARRASGSIHHNLDSIEVVLDTDNLPMESVVHTIELVSGVNVTHGGGGQAGEYLHYKADERDADADGIIDYSTVIMELVQEAQGTSIIKVKCQAIIKADADGFKAVMDAWAERRELAVGLGENFTEATPTPPATLITELTTGSITLEWSEDAFV